MSLARRSVIWWGSHVPSDIARELHSRDLELLTSEEEDVLVQPRVRAVLLPHHPRKGSRALQARARRLLQPVADRGGRLFVVVFGEIERSEAVVQTAGLEVNVLDATAASRVAEACARMDPGPHLGDVELIEVGKTRLDPQDAILLRRAFWEFRSIRVTALRGGLSGAAVLQVDAADHRGRALQPFLVKLDDVKKITSEIDTMRECVIDHMPFPNRPPLNLERCVFGYRRRLLVSALVNRAKRLDEYLADNRAVEAVVSSIFDGPLRYWRASHTRTPLRLGMVYEDLVRGNLAADRPRRHDGALTSAHTLALIADPTAANPFELIQRLRAFPEMEVKACQVHGDLHPRNVFVRDNSTETILIDFAKAGNLGAPMVLDPATLDVALAFDGWEDASTEVPMAEIERLYAPPVFDVAVKDLSHRATAIACVRRHARTDCREESEYMVALAGCLLRVARLLAKGAGHDRKPNPKRAELIALAIRCAQRLLGKLS